MSWQPKVNIDGFAADGQRTSSTELHTEDGKWVRHTIYVRRDGAQVEVRQQNWVVADPHLPDQGEEASPSTVFPPKCRHTAQGEMCTSSNLHCQYPDCLVKGSR